MNLQDKQKCCNSAGTTHGVSCRTFWIFILTLYFASWQTHDTTVLLNYCLKSHLFSFSVSEAYSEIINADL